MDRMRSWWGRTANFVAGVETGQNDGGEEGEGICVVGDDDDKARVYLVTYGGYGLLPSFDPDCLSAMCWLKVCGVGFIAEDSNEPDMSPNGQLPFLMLSNGKCEVDIHAFGERRGCLNVSLSLPSTANTIHDLLLLSIRPAILACYWFEPPMAERTHRHYGRAYPWPINEWLLWRKRQQLQREISPAGESLSEPSQRLVSLKADVLKHLKTLSEMLGPRDYFSGHRPSYNDALAYGLLSVPLALFKPTHEIRTMIETCTNLRTFVNRMRKQYFS